ncbi:DUF5017 domain-containing protein [Pedobacter cryophilus]|uniref:DUF5017 domain-containing protein n=1 Tax=Pedobacter cryophilus TaxID=2571271 RepID=A0A4U1BVR0_9SPHI|nr:DUF5017 domain-containing protein [Pedobacter cryophilus]TKB96895.1 DUF5017 domain-containing protein [Pedobacter cryophilus]
MKKLNLIALLFCVALFGCEKYQLDNLQFDVTAPKTTLKVGEEVTFNFTGNPDNITFFSGEIGKQYEFKDRKSGNGKVELQFTSYLQNNKPNTLKFLASTNFTGISDSASIVNATWVDITNRVTLSSGLDNTASGVVDLTDFRDLNKKVYFAFRYTDNTSTTAQATWTLRDFVVKNTVNNRVFEIMNLADAAWGRYSMINKTNIWTVSATGLRFTGGGANSPNNDAWVIARPADLSFVSKDLGEAIKDINQRLLPQKCIFNTPGTYKVSFLASKGNLETFKSVLKEITIRVEP